MPELEALKPWLVVDAAGPFQGGGYGLALAGCARRRALHRPRLTLATSCWLASQRPRAHGRRTAAGLLAVTGASSTPALSHAALERITRGWLQLDEVVAVISPGTRAPRGLAVVESILSYVGRPVRLFERGGWDHRAGLVAPAKGGHAGAGAALGAALCETPDLDLLPARFPVRRSALFMAGLELAPMHLGLAALGLLVRWRLLSSLRPLARPLRAAAGPARSPRLGPRRRHDRGGHRAGREGASGSARAGRWALCTEANAGPSTPAAPAAALIAALAAGAGDAARGVLGSGAPRPRTPPWHRWPPCPSRPARTRAGQTARSSSSGCWAAASAGCRRRCGPCMGDQRPRRRGRGSGSLGLWRGREDFAPGAGPAAVRAVRCGGHHRSGCARREVEAALRKGPVLLAAGRCEGPASAAGRLRGAVRAGMVPLRPPPDLSGRAVAVDRLERAWPASAEGARAAGAGSRGRGGRALPLPRPGGPPLDRPAVRVPRNLKHSTLNRRVLRHPPPHLYARRETDGDAKSKA